MTIYLNEKPIQTAPETTLAALLAAQDITAAGKAAALNDRAIPPALWPETRLTDGDRILIFRAFYGG